MVDLLTIEETARMLHVHQTTVRRHISQGRLRAVKVGKRVRVRREELERFIEPVPSYSSEKAKEAILKAASSWDDLDTEALLEEIYGRRRIPGRVAVEL